MILIPTFTPFSAGRALLILLDVRGFPVQVRQLHAEHVGCGLGPQPYRHESGTVRFSNVTSMFAERKVRYSALFTNLVGWHASAVSFPLSDVIFAHLACPLSDIMSTCPQILLLAKDS